MNEVREITYLGKTLKTAYYRDLTDAEYQYFVEQYREKPTFDAVRLQLFDLYNGKKKIDIITRYYFGDLMDKVKVSYCKWSIDEVLNNKALVEHIAGVMERNRDYYLESDSISRKMNIAIRVGLKGVCHKPTQFPIKVADSIIRKYNVNNNYYDFSCGWGSRLLASMVNEVNYYGTDPNHVLVERLHQMGDDYDEMFNRRSDFKIYCQGSEKFIPELENKIGLAFSSPPYFGLEDYVIGDQSYNESTPYRDWLTNYMIPTIRNIKRYLIRDGYFIINIKNYDKYDLEGDVVKISEKLGFMLVDVEKMTGSVRKVKIQEEYFIKDIEEKIFVMKRL